VLFVRPVFGRPGRPGGGPAVNRWAALAESVTIVSLCPVL
jgi:hypothetical protein